MLILIGIPYITISVYLMLYIKNVRFNLKLECIFLKQIIYKKDAFMYHNDLYNDNIIYIISCTCQVPFITKDSPSKPLRFITGHIPIKKSHLRKLIASPTEIKSLKVRSASYFLSILGPVLKFNYYLY